MKIIIFTNRDKDPNLTVTQSAVGILQSIGAECVLYEDDPALFDGADAALSLGGDGTFLRCAKHAATRGVPLLGVHLGHTGYLSRIHPERLEELRGIRDFTVREMAVLSGRVLRGLNVVFELTAINDFVFSRGSTVQTVSLELDVDGRALGSFLGDGVIVATATGSTGYSLSAGGPVADPSLRIMLVTPICAHTSHDHAFILAPNRTLCVTPSHAERRMIYLSADGEEPFRLEAGDRVEIIVSEHVLRCLEPEEHNFFDNVRIHRL